MFRKGIGWLSKYLWMWVIYKKNFTNTLTVSVLPWLPTDITFIRAINMYWCIIFQNSSKFSPRNHWHMQWTSTSKPYKLCKDDHHHIFTHNNGNVQCYSHLIGGNISHKVGERNCTFCPHCSIPYRKWW